MEEVAGSVSRPIPTDEVCDDMPVDLGGGGRDDPILLDPLAIIPGPGALDNASVGTGPPKGVSKRT